VPAPTLPFGEIAPEHGCELHHRLDRDAAVGEGFLDLRTRVHGDLRRGAWILVTKFKPGRPTRQVLGVGVGQTCVGEILCPDLERIGRELGGVRAEDVLEVTVWRNVDLSKIVQVRPDGRISMPIIRDMTAVGKTPSQLAEEMTNKLKEYVQNPVVAVSLKEVNSSNVFVLGEVVKPGKYPLKSKTTLLQGITVAGGFTPIAARNQIVIFRFIENAPGIKRLTASYDDIVLRGGITDNFELKSGDTVVIPSEAMVVFPGR